MADGIELSARQLYIARELLFAAVGGSTDGWARVRREVARDHGPDAGQVTTREVDDTVRLLMLANPRPAVIPGQSVFGPDCAVP